MSELIGSMLGILANTQEVFTPRQRGIAAADLAVKIADMQERNAELEGLLYEIFSDPNTHRLNDDIRDRIEALMQTDKKEGKG